MSLWTICRALRPARVRERIAIAAAAAASSSSKQLMRGGSGDPARVAWQVDRKLSQRVFAFVVTLAQWA